MDYATAFREAFIKKAQEYKICRPAAEALFKEAGFGDFMTNISDGAKGLALKLTNNPLTHATNAINPFSKEVTSFGDYIKGMGDRYTQSQSQSNLVRADHDINTATHQLEQGNQMEAQSLFNRAQQRGQWVNGADGKNFIGDKIQGVTNKFNQQAQQEYQDYLNRQRIENDAYNRLNGPVQLWNPSMGMPQQQPQPQPRPQPAQPPRPQMPSVPQMKPQGMIQAPGMRPLAPQPTVGRQSYGL